MMVKKILSLSCLGVLCGLFAMHTSTDTQSLVEVVGDSEMTLVYGANGIGTDDCWVLVSHNCPVAPEGTCEVGDNGNCTEAYFGPGPDNIRDTADDEYVWECDLAGSWKTKEDTNTLSHYYTADSSASGHHNTDNKQYLCYTQIKCNALCYFVDNFGTLNDYWACSENGSTEEEGEKYNGKTVFNADCLPVEPVF